MTQDEIDHFLNWIWWRLDPRLRNMTQLATALQPVSKQLVIAREGSHNRGRLDIDVRSLGDLNQGYPGVVRVSVCEEGMWKPILRWREDPNTPWDLGDQEYHVGFLHVEDTFGIALDLVNSCGVAFMFDERGRAPACQQCPHQLACLETA